MMIAGLAARSTAVAITAPVSPKSTKPRTAMPESKERDQFVLNRCNQSTLRGVRAIESVAGEALESSAIDAALAVNDIALSSLSPEEREQFLGLMGKIIRTFDDGEGAAADD